MNYRTDECFDKAPIKPEPKEKGKLIMEAYIKRIKGNRSIKDRPKELIDMKTNKIIKYI